MIGFMTYKDTEMGKKFIEYDRGYVIVPCYEGPRCRIVFDSGFSIYAQSGRRLEKLEEAWKAMLSKIQVITPFFIEGELTTSNEEEPLTPGNVLLYVTDYVSSPSIPYYQRSLQRKNFFARNEKILRDSAIRNTSEGYDVMINQHTVLMCLESYYKLGHDSIILRDTSAPYVEGPSNGLLLVKDHNRFNLRIKEIEMAGDSLTIKVEDKDGKMFDLSVDSEHKLYDDIALDRGNFIGKTAVVSRKDNQFELLSIKFVTRKVDRIKE